MATDGKQGLRTPPRARAGASSSNATRTGAQSGTSNANASNLNASSTTSAGKTVAEHQPHQPLTPPTLYSAARDTLRDAAFDKRPYLKWAFVNPYNLSLLGGALAASVLTLNPFLAIAALGLEGLWLLHGPESKLLRRILWDPKFDKIRQALEQQALDERLQNLEGRERQRVENLIAMQQQIQTLAAQNPSFTGELLRSELQKTGRLVQAFIDMAVTCARYETYLDSIDIAGLDRERNRWENIVKQSKEGDQTTDIAKKNLAIILKRFEKLTEIRRYVTIVHGQLELIENSFQLIADQIVTMQSPQELTGQLNELLDGVESIKQTAIDTERLLSGL